MPWGIQTVYLPRENVRFLEEWLQYHSMLGAEYFFLYDNTGSQTIDLGNSVAVNGKNKYGMSLDFYLSDRQIEEVEAEILKKYPVTKVKWQPRQDGKIVYGQTLACDHFSESARVDWCAFIDIDEFLCTPHRVGDLLKGKAIKILQKKFDDRFNYRTALEVTKTFSINTKRWSPKLIINMRHYRSGAKSIHDLKINSFFGPVLQDFGELRFNHYNHNPRGHEWLLENCHWIDKSWRPVDFENVFAERCEQLHRLSKQINYEDFEKIPLRLAGTERSFAGE
jgi:Glycosyl transferase family 2